MRFPAGTHLGPYEITGPIGAGGMGEVYRARDTRLGREVAIKVLPKDVADSAERLSRFEREARSASGLNHPAIVTIHEFARDGGQAYLVMELVRGESLRDVLARGSVPLRRLFSIAAGLAEGLAAAHGAGIVHRDLKPENVMLTNEGAPKILDFGLVKSVSALADLSHSSTELQLSEAGSLLGTASYMSPEQARGEPVDFRSDQFALGVILYEMATGHHPFQRGTPVETLAAILNDEPEPLSDAVPEPFVWIVERCLAKHPSERYGSTADLSRDLARLRDRSSGVVRPGARPAPPARRWWIAPAAAALLVVLVAAAVTMMRRSPPPLGDALQVSVSMPPIADVFIGEVAQPVAISPDGRHLAIYGADADGTNHVWLHDLRSGATRLLAENGFAAAWSTDSRAIAYFADGKLKTVAVEGGPAHVVCDARPESTPSWHGDTILFAQYSRAPGIYRVSARGGTPELIVGPEGANHDFAWWPQFLPDGKRFLFLGLRHPEGERQEITHVLYAGSLDGAAPQSIAAISSRVVFADGHLLFVREGTLLAQPFDPDTLRFTGEAMPLLDGLHYFRNTGLAAFSVSANGVIAWRSARAPSRLVWLDRNGMEVGSIGTLHSEDGRLSPDGKRFAVGIVDPKTGGSDIWIYDLARDSRDRMTFLLMDEKNPVWAPDGTIYYRSDGGGGPPDIFKLTPGQEGREVAYRGPGVNEPHDVSPDGRWLLFIDYTPPVGADISVLPLATPGPPRPFVATRFQELSPRFSPDGRWVAYSSDISGRPEVYVRPFEGATTALKISQSGGTRPRWRPDGQELFFVAPGGRVMVVPASGDFGVPRILFQAADAADFEVNADGTRFLVHLRERREPVHMLLNWQARLPAQR